MDESDFNFDVASALRDAIGSHLGLAGDFLQGGKIIHLFGMGKPTAATWAGMKLGYNPKQTAALLVVTEKFSFDEENKGFFKMFNSKVTTKKIELEKLMVAFAPEIKSIKPDAIGVFAKTYFPLIQEATDEFNEGMAEFGSAKR